MIASDLGKPHSEMAERVKVNQAAPAMADRHLTCFSAATAAFSMLLNRQFEVGRCSSQAHTYFSSRHSHNATCCFLRRSIRNVTNSFRTRHLCLRPCNTTRHCFTWRRFAPSHFGSAPPFRATPLATLLIPAVGAIGSMLPAWRWRLHRPPHS